MSNEIFPNMRLYQFDFVSPRWSPDLAGWSLLAVPLGLASFVFTAVDRYGLKRQSR